VPFIPGLGTYRGTRAMVAGDDPQIGQRPAEQLRGTA
jgi:hypothetical protein